MTSAGPVPDLAAFRAAILAAEPARADARVTLLPGGYDSVGVDVDDRVVFRFPRHAAAAESLAREARVLAVLRPALAGAGVAVPVPDLAFHPGPPAFTRHAKLRGRHLLAEDYARLLPAARARLADDLARFLAALHDLDRAPLAAAGAAPVRAWPDADAIRRRIAPVLPAELRRYADATLAAWQALPGGPGADPHGEVFGFFDLHGWNMAFDPAPHCPAQARLTGIYDFGDAGFGPLHRDFVSPSLIARDLTQRLIRAYEAVSRRAIDRRRVDLLTGVHRLVELAEAADDPAQCQRVLPFIVDWAREAGAAA